MYAHFVLCDWTGGGYPPKRRGGGGGAGRGGVHFVHVSSYTTIMCERDSLEHYMEFKFDF